MQKDSQVRTLIATVVVLLAALAVGVGIRKIRLHRAEPKPQHQESKAAVGARQEPNLTSLAEQDEGSLRALNELARVEEPQTMADKEPALEHKSDAAVAQEEGAPLEQQGQMAQGPYNWASAWADLNLTAEEKARLQRGFELARQRWQNMSPEQRQAEIERMKAGWERWQNMSDQERKEAMQRMRQQFEQWRQSGSEELPIPSLD
jgi:hypothetical protein